jgi:hypothetical protein
MTDDDMRMKMEFIVNQQAQFAADIGRLENSIVRLENSVGQVTGIVGQLASASLDRFTNLEEKVSALVDAQIKTESSVSALADKVVVLAEYQAHTDRRLDALIDIIREQRNGKSQG